jgi:hypothetical protein
VLGDVSVSSGQSCRMRPSAAEVPPWLPAPVTVNDILGRPRGTEPASFDRIYLSGYVPNVQVGWQVVNFLTHCGYAILSPALLKAKAPGSGGRWSPTPKPTQCRGCDSIREGDRKRRRWSAPGAPACTPLAASPTAACAPTWPSCSARRHAGPDELRLRQLRLRLREIITRLPHSTPTCLLPKDCASRSFTARSKTDFCAHYAPTPHRTPLPVRRAFQTLERHVAHHVA